MRIKVSLLTVLTAFGAAGAWAADPANGVVVSAANVNVGVAPDSLATVFGNKLATQTASAPLPWPTRLGDMNVVYVKDSAAKMQTAELIYVSPTQMNLWIPPGTAVGPATVMFPVTGLPLGEGTAALRSIPVSIQRVAPGLFSADGAGTGVAAATATRVLIPSGMQSPVPVIQCNGSSGCTAVPIDLGIDTPVYLSLYGTGIRGASMLSNVVVTIGGTQLQALYAGPQPGIPGVDQVNVALPLSLRGSGLVKVTVTVDGVSSNAVEIAIQ